MRLFVKKSDLISIPIFVYEEDGQTIATFTKSETSSIDNVETVKFIFRRPSYSDSVNITTKSQLQLAQTDDASINASSIVTFQNLIFKTLISDWDIKDENGQKVPVNSENINSLEPLVARAAVSGLLTKIQI